MFLLNNIKVHQDIQRTIGDVQYPAGWFSHDAEARAKVGMIEVPDIPRPDDNLFTSVENPDGSWTATPRTAEDLAARFATAKAAQITTLHTAYAAAIRLPVAYMATTFQADSASQDVLTKCLVAGSVPTGFYWLDATNAQVPMTFAQLQGLAGAMLAQGQAAFIKLQARKAAVRDALTVDAVQAVVW